MKESGSDESGSNKPARLRVAHASCQGMLWLYGAERGQREICLRDAAQGKCRAAIARL